MSTTLPSSLLYRIAKLEANLALAKSNTCHVGGGSKGGQFCATDGGGGGGVSLKDQQDAIERYQTASWSTNDPLRGLGRPGDVVNEKTVAGLDAAFDRSRTSSEKVLYRGIRGGFATTLASAPIGTTVTDAGYTSTTTSRSIASGFATKYGTGVVLHVTVPKGSKALPIPGNEKEMLLPRNSTFQITKIEKPPGKAPAIVHVSVVSGE